ncbi:MAG: molybdenum cofactor guanylyltransferase [Candidatus Baltobacteraceae bacterium]
MPRLSEIGVLILGGGEATRLPGKLELEAGDLPLLARVARNTAGGRETFVACKGSFPPALDALVPGTAVVDRWSRRGPLAGLLTTMSRMHARFVFAVAGDAPLIDARFIEALAGSLREGDEAIVPRHSRDGKAQLEPLAALYDRLAFLREGLPVLRSGRGRLDLVIARLRARFVEVADARIFANVNTPADYAALRAQLGEPA